MHADQHPTKTTRHRLTATVLPDTAPTDRNEDRTDPQTGRRATRRKDVA